MSRLKDNYESLRPLIVWLGLAELISGELASGAMGEVYRPRDLKLGRAVQHDGGARRNPGLEQLCRHEGPQPSVRGRSGRRAEA